MRNKNTGNQKKLYNLKALETSKLVTLIRQPMAKKSKKRNIKSVIADNALEEAKDRDRLRTKVTMPKELGGRDGLEPTRYGDWEKKGLISDF